MKRGHKELWIVSVLLIIVVILSIGFRTFKQNQIYHKVQDLEHAYNIQDFDLALSLTGKLPDKYQHYYHDFIAYAKEINTWSGTCSELIDWFNAFFDQFASTEPIEIGLPEEYCWRYSDRINNAREKFGEGEDYSKMLEWYPQLKQVEESCFSEFYNRMGDYSELFFPSEGEDPLSIPVDQIKEFDRAIQEWCTQWFSYYHGLIQEMQDIFDSNLLMKYLNDFQSRMKKCYEAYLENSLSRLYDISDDMEFVSITKEVANINRLLFDSSIVNTISSDAFSDALRATDSYREDYYLKHNDIARELLDVIEIVFGCVEPTITDGINFTIGQTISVISDSK